MKKRFETRRLVSRPIEVITSFWDTPIGFQTLDLSPRGAYVASELIPDMGDQVVCCFDLGFGKEFSFFGQVVRVNMMRRKTDILNPGFGIHFLDATPMERLRIRSRLTDAPPPLPRIRRLPKTGVHKAGEFGLGQRLLDLPRVPRPGLR